MGEGFGVGKKIVVFIFFYGRDFVFFVCVFFFLISNVFANPEGFALFVYEIELKPQNKQKKRIPLN